MSDMTSTQPTENPSPPRKGRKYFKLAEARRALPLVKRIAADIQRVQAQRLALHTELSAGLATLAPKKQEELARAFNTETDRLEKLVAELTHIGVELKDPGRGLIDFPALHEGREILLCWRGDEDDISHWHELDTGFAGRRPVSELSDC